jgi:thymidylate synthase (FAD)
MSQIKVTYLDHCGSDLTTVNAARVSFGKKSDWEYPALQEGLLDKDAKLIGYLAKHGHISPFGHCFASFHVKAPIFVARQLVKHKFLRWNEISRRYVDEEPEFYVPDVWRGRSANKKQGSEGFVEDYNTTALPLWNDDALKYYNMLLGSGVAPEQARMVLPQNTMTEWYWSGSLDAFASMCNLRLMPDTQYESRIVAQQVSDMMEELFPVSWISLVDKVVSDVVL